MSTAEINFYGTHAKVFHDTHLLVNAEGAVRSGKTTVCLIKVLALCQRYPGIYGIIARFSDDDTNKLLKPIWRELCLRAGVHLTWHPDESYDELDNSSRVYITGLKTQEATNPYRKFRGLTLAFFYVDQAEELPHGHWQELTLRLSQKGYPHLGLTSPQSDVSDDHWIVKEFPTDKPLKSDRAHYALSTRDNAQNLDDGYITRMEDIHPPGTPLHTTLILGQRGARITGDPVYGAPADGSRPGIFLRSRHVRSIGYDHRLRVEIGLDFGKHHPCLIARQVSSVGQIRYLAGILGSDLMLDAFLPEAQRLLTVWFPDAEQAWCCDPAGVSNPIGVDMGKVLRAHGIDARFKEDSNSPAARVSIIERISANMRARGLDGDEKLVVSDSDEHWVRLSAHGTVTRHLVANAFEFGYVWDKHMVSVGSKQMRKPLKDGQHEHPMNCVEYLEANFGASAGKKPERKIARGPRVYSGEMGYAS